MATQSDSTSSRSAPALPECQLRGPRIGERQCPTCGDRKVMLHVFSCPFFQDGVTVYDCIRHRSLFPNGVCGPIPTDSIPFNTWKDSQNNELWFWRVQRQAGNPEQRHRNVYYRSPLQDGCTILSNAFQSSDFTQQTLLDAGSGPEGILHTLSAKRKIAVDPLMDRFRELGYDVSAHDVEPVNLPMEHLSILGSGFVDTAFCFNALDHSMNPQLCLQNLASVLRDGGQLWLFVDLRPPRALDAYHRISLSKPSLESWLLKHFDIVESHTTEPNAFGISHYIAILRKRPSDPRTSTPSLRSPLLSVVITSLNEKQELLETCRSIRQAEPNAELIVVDDASSTPEPESTIRNLTRLGVAASRHVGASQATGEVVVFVDAHMRFKPGSLTAVAETALKFQGFAYAGCNGHHAAALLWDNGILRGKWFPKPRSSLQRTTCMMGACYAVPRSILEGLGGWIMLPGYWGMDEEAMSILAIKNQIPIVCCTEIQNEHVFRGFPGAPPVPYVVPQDRYLVNIAAVYRLLFDDPVWRYMRQRLTEFTLDGKPVCIPEHVLQEVESPVMAEYGVELRSKCKLSDAEFFIELATLTEQQRSNTV